MTAGRKISVKAEPLQGVGVVVTRPREQAGHLGKMIEAAGGHPIMFPVLEILDAKDLPPLHAMIDRLDEFDLAIFISPTAVSKAMNLIKARRALPQHLKIAAVGRGSARELAHFGITDVLLPQARFDSEHLLALPALQDVAGKRIVVFRGEGGRDLLKDELTRRGAQVEHAECYRRGRPNADAAPLLRLWARDELHAVIVTSGESMRNLFDLVGKPGQQWLKKTPVFAPHEKIAAVARELGLEQVIVTPSGDEGLLQGLIEWGRKRSANER